MKILATYNIKGGVGKTAAAVNLAFFASRGGARTLVWDLDPQGAATFYFRVKPRVKGGGKRLIQGKGDLHGQIKGTDYPDLDLLPADFSYRHMDIVLDDAKKPTNRLRKLEDNQVIVGYTVRLKPEAQTERIRAWMGVLIDGNRTRQVIASLLGEPGVSALHDTNGRWDLLAELEVGSMKELSDTLERVRLISGIQSTETSIHLASYR